MKISHYFNVALSCATLLFALFATAALASDSPKVEAPSAFVPVNEYVFESVIEGTEVVHDFIIQNKGTGDLNILNVRTG